MKRSLLLLCLLGLALAPSALARSDQPEVRIGRAALSSPLSGRGSLLVPVSYPLALVGHRLDLGVSLLHGGHVVRDWTLHPLANGGVRETPGSRSFRFVHRIELGRELTREVGRGWTLRVEASGAFDANRDGKLELNSTDVSSQALQRRPAASLCATVPQLRARPGQRIEVALPACLTPARWRIAARPRHGRARIRYGRLVYRSAKRFRGTEELALAGSPAAARVGETRSAPIVVKVGGTPSAVVRALGDSVTAGFGYYDDGAEMPLRNLLECKPGEQFYDDACSSNSIVTSNAGTKVEYAPDYGLHVDVSWAAQWANEYGITNYENLAVSGSEPGNWAPGGSLYETTKRIESEDPDYILMTVGANPLLSEMLFGTDNMGCAIYSDLFGGYRECIERAFAQVGLRENLERLYADLVAKTSATIYLMQYHLAIPSTALAYTSFQIAQMGELVNREIASVAAAVSPGRLEVVTPPHFNVGIDISPVYPSKFSCSRLGYEVDGPSVQIAATQDELLAAHPLSFCEGPVEGQPAWVISGDTGIHPSTTGYAQMASRVPPPS